MATGVLFEDFTGHVLEVDWPDVVAGVGTYGEWESPPSEASVIASGYMTTEITSKYVYSLLRMLVVPQTFADFTAKFRPQMAAEHFNHISGGGRTHVSTSTMMAWVHVRSVVLRLHFLGESAADMGVVGLSGARSACARRGFVWPGIVQGLWLCEAKQANFHCPPKTQA